MMGGWLPLAHTALRELKAVRVELVNIRRLLESREEVREDAVRRKQSRSVAG